ncbi:MAG: response regulator [Verrucomicrobiae bacterium]|nr:response regulator [Verrucomicrobiae bacterium]NNJ43937.1 response regulator [Akkermansiaceae bacterium]
MKEDLEILLVEDNPHDAELTIRALKKWDLASHLCHVSDGQEAHDFLFATGAYQGRDVREQPKLILLDLKLPKLDGMDVLREIRADERTKHLLVVVLTSSSENSDVTSAYRIGANSYVVKPMGFQSYLDVVGKMGRYWMKTNVFPNN